MEKLNLAEKFVRIDEVYKPKLIAEPGDMTAEPERI